jgi:hypothetical protein
MNVFVGQRHSRFLLPYLQFLFIAISECSYSDILTYVESSVEIVTLLDIAEKSDRMISLFALNILGALRDKKYLSYDVFSDLSGFEVLHRIIENAPSCCRTRAFHVFARFAPELSADVALWFLEPQMIWIYTDFIANVVSSGLRETLDPILTLLDKVQGLGDYESVVACFAEADFLDVLHTSIENSDLEGDVVLAYETRLRSQLS